MAIEQQRRAAGGLEWLDIAGHSLAAGGGARLVPVGGYALRAKRALGIARVHDLSIGGAIACHPNAGANGDGGYPWVLRNTARPGALGVTAAAASPYIPASQLALVHYGLNDLGQLGAANPLPFKTALRTILARYCAAAIFESGGGAGEAASAQWAYTGTWLNLGVPDANASCDGDGVRYTSTVGDKATLTIPNDMPAGRVVHIGLFFNSTWGACVYGVRLLRGGQPVGNPAAIQVTGTQLCDQNTPNMHLIHTVRFGTGDATNANDPLGGVTLQPGDQIELTLTSGPTMGIDFGGIEADPLDGPLLVCPLPNKPGGYTIWGSWPGGASMNDAAVDTWKGHERAVLAEFPRRVISDGYGLGIDLDMVPDTNRYTAPPGTNLAPAGVEPGFVNDGAHPTEIQGAKWAEYIADVINGSPLVTDRIRTRPMVDPKPRSFKKVGIHNGAGALNTGWSNYNTGVGPWTLPWFSWRMDENRRVYVRGALKAAAGAALGILPANSLPKPAQIKDGITVAQFDGTTWTMRLARVDQTGAFLLIGGTVSTVAGNAINFEFDYQAEL